MKSSAFITFCLPDTPCDQPHDYPHKKAHCLYALLTEASINFSSLVTSTMMSVRLMDKSVAMPYGALITRIAEHVEMPMAGLKETQP